MAAASSCPSEIARLRESGVTIFSPEDGQRLGLAGMINQMVEACDHDLWDVAPADADAVLAGHRDAIARAITGAETGRLDDALRSAIHDAAEAATRPALGITGTGGSGKSSLTDELVRRFRTDQQDKLRIAVLAIDPTRRKGGGALLGDRIRMNALGRSGPTSTSAPWPPGAATSTPTTSTTSSPCSRPPASTSSSSRPPASARATPASSRSSTARCT